MRRRPAQAAILLVSITAATAMLSLGGPLHGATEKLYQQTRAVTAGPDMAAFSPGADPTTITVLRSLEQPPDQRRSKMAASPWPPPMHIVSSP